MRTITLFFSLMLLFASLSFSQRPDEDKQSRIQAQRIAFLTDELDLSIEEAQAFWPVYNEYQKAKNKISQEREEYKTQMTRIAKLNDEDCETYSDKYIALEMAEAKLADEFHSRYKKVLPVKKVFLLYQAESKFKTYLLQQLREKKDGQE